MANIFYNPTGNPATGSEGLSSLVRAEFASISAGFDLIPRFTTTGLFDTIFAQVASVTITLPGISGTMATLAGAETLSNKTLAAPVVTGVGVFPTAAPGTSTTQPATTAFATAAVGVETTARTAADAAEVTARNTAIGVETSRATAAEALLAPKASPALTGTPTAPTATVGTNTTQLATTAYVQAATSAVVAGVSSVAGRSGAVVLTNADVSGSAPLASPALTGVPAAPTAVPGTSTTQLATTAYGTAAVLVETTRAVAAEAAETVARLAGDAGALFGLTLSNDGGTPNTVLDIAAGSCTDSTNTARITLGTFTKSIAGSWVAGTGNNGMGVGLTATLSTWYHVFAIVVSGVADVYFDTSVTAANKPASTTAFRRIGSVATDSSVHLQQFVQHGDRFDWVTPTQNFSGTPGVTTAQTLALNAPLGIVTEVFLTGNIGDPTSLPVLYISALFQTDTAPGTTAITAEANASPGVTAISGYYIRVFTNTSSQIRFRCATTTMGLIVIMNGWIDTRGK